MKEIPSWVCPICERRFINRIEEHYEQKHYNLWLGVKRTLRTKRS